MASDRTGNRYEQILEASLLDLGYVKDSDYKNNYIHPSPREKIVIPGTFIQPDFIVRHNTNIRAILYVTHWSNRRNCNFKFWRTWEELCQQKVIIKDNFISINCVFEALPVNTSPFFCKVSDDLPIDKTSKKLKPIAFNGWYAATTSAMVESFDVSLAFPKSYLLRDSNYDRETNNLLLQALQEQPKHYFLSQWEMSKHIRSNAKNKIPNNLTHTRSRYRIGLLHVYLIYRIFCYLVLNTEIKIDSFIEALILNKEDKINLKKLSLNPVFSSISYDELAKIFAFLETIYVRKSKDAETLCNITTVRNPNNHKIRIDRVSFNKDLIICLQDMKQHIKDATFIDAIDKAFVRFDETLGINECFEDLANKQLVVSKESFVRSIFSKALQEEDEAHLNQLLQAHAKLISDQRRKISSHHQNWVLEILLYITGLNSVEDVQTKLKENFEKIAFPHLLRPHAPYGDEAKLGGYLLQGRSICEHWSSKSTKRTLTETEFATLSWQSTARCIIQAFKEKKSEIIQPEIVIKKYIQNKSMRIIGADLNSLNILLDYFLGDLCKFYFNKDLTDDEKSIRICPSLQTDIINNIWSGRPLETWMDGFSKNKKWLIKIQSSQDGNESHKTKELAGRCRAIHIAWSHGLDPKKRDEWLFNKRQLPKLALVLDGDWSIKNKRNLYEAGWDWVGDISQLGELRQLIQEETI